MKKTLLCIFALVAATFSPALADTPDAFLEYIKSGSSQYIDTGVPAKMGVNAQMTIYFEATPSGSSAVFFGADGGNANAYKLVRTMQGQGYTQPIIGSSSFWGDGTGLSNWSGGDTLVAGNSYEIESGVSSDGVYSLKVNGGGYTQTTTPTRNVGTISDAGRNYYIFACNSSGTAAEFANGRCYGVKIWVDDVLVRDFQPCKKGGRAGMLDAVSGTIYYSASGTDFVAGPEKVVADAVWTNTAGDSSFENAENWSTGYVPGDGASISIVVTNDVTLVASSAHNYSAISVTNSGSCTLPSTITSAKFEVLSGSTLVCSTVSGLEDGKLIGAGTFVLDPGSGNTITMTQSNTDFTGEAVIKSGIVKFGNSTSFGPINRSSVIRVKDGATLDQNNKGDGTYGKEKQTVVLEDGAKLISNPGMSDPKCSNLTTITLEGDATIDASSGTVSIGQHYNDGYTHLNLGTNTLTVVGGTFFVSYCTISGTGTIDIQSGATVQSTHDYDNVDVSTTCADGTIHIREGATWDLDAYYGHVSRLSVKNLILDGSVTRDDTSYTLTVTGSITGNGTTPTLTMGDGAVFKPTGDGYLTITESLSGTMTIDLSDVEADATLPMPLFKVGSSSMLPDASSIVVTGAKFPCELVQTEDGFGYDLDVADVNYASYIESSGSEYIDTGIPANSCRG